jgi:hypothetical protein
VALATPEPYFGVGAWSRSSAAHRRGSRRGARRGPRCGLEGGVRLDHGACRSPGPWSPAGLCRRTPR